MRDIEIAEIIKNALVEDAAREDITTRALIPSGLKCSAKIIAKESGVACGLTIAGLVFRQLDKDIKFKTKVKDGAKIKKGACLAELSGSARQILSAERVALNLLGHLSGIATLTRQFVEKVNSYKVKILDTRKTTPNLRILERYAVRCGSGFNHRLNLSDQILIKDNHIQATGYMLHATGLKEMIEKAREKAKGKKIEIEVENLRQFRQALAARPDIIMLDNFKLSDIREAVKIRNHSPFTIHQSPIKLEASGGITLENVKQVASCGVDFISIGALTHSVKSLDLSLEIG